MTVSRTRLKMSKRDELDVGNRDEGAGCELRETEVHGVLEQ
jgi:hypothetical protein